jgi:hypothetical protein
MLGNLSNEAAVCNHKGLVILTVIVVRCVSSRNNNYVSGTYEGPVYIADLLLHVAYILFTYFSKHLETLVRNCTEPSMDYYAYCILQS